MSIKNIVIIGAGQAGANAILQLRALQYTGTITLIGDETHLPYERPPLSKDAILDPENTKLEILSVQKLQDLGVRHISGTAVVSIDRDAKQVVLANADRIAYDKLLIATGGSARRLPALDALEKHVYTLRNLEDAQALIPVLQPGRRIVLVGGGVIGLELASSAQFRGCQVTVLEAGPRVMGRCAPQLLTDFMAQQHRQHGVNILLNTHMASCHLDGEVVKVELQNGEVLEADAVIYGIGIVANAQLAVDAGLEVDAAIIVNEFAQTSDPDIYAAGDVAKQRLANGQMQRIESWENANRQAESFARHVMGASPLTEQAPWFWTDQLGANFQFVGAMDAEQWYVRGEMESSGVLSNFILFGVTNGVITAAIAVNAAKEMRHLKKMVNTTQAFKMEQHLDCSLALKSMC
ncbi:3-phenylpropionate/cinnamic acid dioxygenase ferredoxin--NAD(+) reductase subunit [Acinetobacter rudis]|uniref:Phenylpropionate dioxygenase ferredoxin reductase subunit n=1 Tax=Acinetobacter rudis TaxID=632955 RepID=A0AAW8JGQ2_9GAMM|nr:3-phenylpropionate/cinnamic acid dioxygenase ferredoxin--NAD(+) reductase subunit [Acinetobacter rudis]MDQ8936894.1 phenylpropionate dioxygenase ferredoxin reductase subunit [Acinetobacter rudis]MDQ8953712.1 phenylpropionate dioxygenase ferredoxin reductase subunit [Acinetobacter rudis]MDQ9019114.1 phenylpropionate dioxygenase ferredoxin reductase subunit [Acinetobacter rudis]